MTINLAEITGLNPCFNGRYSQRTSAKTQTLKTSTVLILVLMEDTLRDLMRNRLL